MNLFTKNEYVQNNIINARYQRFSVNTVPHQHEFFELEYFIKGTGDYVVNGTHYPILPDTVFFVSPTSIQSYTINEPVELITVMFVPNANMEKSLYRVASSNDFAYCIKHDSDKMLMKSLLYEILTSISENKNTYALNLLVCVIQKLSYLCPKKDNESISYVRKAMLYTLENFTQPITLADVASVVGLDSSYFSKLFKKDQGLSYKIYLDNIRFDYATNLLRFSDMDIKNICIESGFSDYANFSRRFKEKYKCTPSEYRNLHKINE